MDIMIDCETWGLIPGSVIRSVGIVAFEPFGSEFEAGREFLFEMNVNIREPDAGYLPLQPSPMPAPGQQSFGATPPGGKYRRYATVQAGPNGHDFYKQASTVEWWAKPENVEAAKMLAENAEPVEMALGRIMQFIALMKPANVWARGPQGDIVWLEYYFRAYGYEIPWNYGDVLDARTHGRTCNIDLDEVAAALEANGKTFTKHYALDDARFQAYCVQAGNWSLETMRRAYIEMVRPTEAKPVGA